MSPGGNWAQTRAFYTLSREPFQPHLSLIYVIYRDGLSKKIIFPNVKIYSLLVLSLRRLASLANQLLPKQYPLTMRDTKRLRFDLTNRSHHDLLESHLHKLSRAVKVSATSRKNRQMHGKLKTRSCKFGPILCLVSCLTFLFIIKLFRIRRKIFSIGFLARVHSIPRP